MAPKTEKSSDAITEETSHRVDRVTIAMARGEEVSAEDEAWIADFNAKQEIVQSALTEGRHVEEARVQLGDNLTSVTWTEYIPQPGGDVFVRRGRDLIESGWSGDTVTRTVKYWGSDGDLSSKGIVESVISGGSEEITNIIGFGDGGEYAGLQVGATRPSPVPSKGAAGQRPQSWDPGNGAFGTASGGSNSTTADRPAATSRTDSVDAPGTAGSDTGDATQETADADPDEGTNGGSDDGDRQPDAVDADPGPGDEGGTDGGDTSSAQTHDQPPPAPKTQQRSDTTADDGMKAYGAFEHAKNVNTGQVGAKTESGNIATTAGTVKPVTGHWEDTDERSTDDGYSYIGEPPPANPGGSETVRSAGGGGGGASSQPFNPNDPANANSSITQYDYLGAPIDYGNAADPFHDPVIPDSDEMARPDDVTPAILVDPSFYEVSTVSSTTRLEMEGSLVNTGNPLDENQAQLPGSGMPNTSEQELVVGDGVAAMAGDAWAASAPNLGPALEAPAIGEGAPSAFNDDDPLP